MLSHSCGCPRCWVCRGQPRGKGNMEKIVMYILELVKDKIISGEEACVLMERATTLIQSQ